MSLREQIRDRKTPNVTPRGREAEKFARTFYKMGFLEVPLNSTNLAKNSGYGAIFADLAFCFHTSTICDAIFHSR